MGQDFRAELVEKEGTPVPSQLDARATQFRSYRSAKPGLLRRPGPTPDRRSSFTRGPAPHQREYYPRAKAFGVGPHKVLLFGSPKWVPPKFRSSGNPSPMHEVPTFMETIGTGTCRGDEGRFR